MGTVRSSNFFLARYIRLVKKYLNRIPKLTPLSHLKLETYYTLKHIVLISFVAKVLGNMVLYSHLNTFDKTEYSY